jgi:hypothetical protein
VPSSSPKYLLLFCIAWFQAQWEEWLLVLVKDTLEEVDLVRKKRFSDDAAFFDGCEWFMIGHRTVRCLPMF